MVVNAVYVDPGDSNRVLLATDRGGVLTSQDAGVTFAPSNEGISERKVAAVLVDRDNPDVLYAGVVNDKKYGGVFRSSDGGAHWEQLGSGLDGSDVFALAETKEGEWSRERAMAFLCWAMEVMRLRRVIRLRPAMLRRRRVIRLLR